MWYITFPFTYVNFVCRSVTIVSFLQCEMLLIKTITIHSWFSPFKVLLAPGTRETRVVLKVLC